MSVWLVQVKNNFSHPHRWETVGECESYDEAEDLSENYWRAGHTLKIIERKEVAKFIESHHATRVAENKEDEG